MFLRLALCLLFALSGLWPSVPTYVRGESADPVDFLTQVKPILLAHCGDCHGTDEQNGGLSFDDRSSVFGQADSGMHAIVAGDPDASELIKRVTARDEDIRMPPEGEPLTKTQVQWLRDWIADGARWPDSDSAGGHKTAKNTHWAFQPVRRVKPPPVNDADWPRVALDRFVQARREAAGLGVAKDAEPLTLIRRSSYVLTGLPPTPQEVQQFVSQVDSVGKERAFADWVDRLLQRKTYGERWGRHWMDWVRYADTAGDNSDFPIPQAYLYRNYIIDSINDDVPYDRFLIEQLAGDLLPAETQAERNRLNIATGYLAMARRFGSLIERYPWHLTIEDTIDNVGRTMMGLTLSCARCHDHKFDPLTTRDYYGLYGIFASTRYPQPGLELFQSQQHLVPLIPQAEVDEALKGSREETEKLSKRLEELLASCEKRKIDNARKEASATIAEQRRMKDELDGMLIQARKAGEKLAEHLKKQPTVPVAYAVQDGRPQDAFLQIKGEPSRPGAKIKRRFPGILGGYSLPADVAESGSGRLQLAHWIADKNNPLTARVIVNRVWQRHFGQGIVPSTSDFGLRGQSPTHPELLDWLTADFIDNGWSLKHLHSTIMLSRTWQLTSLDVPGYLETDPTNQFYWKANRRRLDAESIRDTLKYIAGTLDPTPQTEPYPIPPQREWKYTQHHPFKDDYASDKRSVYLMIKRLTQASYFQTFDGADPNVCTSDRDESVTPLQALYFVNDEFFHDQAEHFAKFLLENADDTPRRIDRAFLSILGRWPDEEESQVVEKHIAQITDRLRSEKSAEHQAWSSLVRSLLRVNEFLYVD